MALFPAPRLYGGRMWWPGEHTAEVADAYRRLTARLRDIKHRRDPANLFRGSFPVRQ